MGSGTEMTGQSKNTEGKSRWIDTISAVILAVASVVSAWCAYQSSQWNGEQTSRLDDENIADNNRMQKEIAAAQRQTGEANLFLYYAEAVTTENKELKDFLEARFPPHFKQAFESWKALDPANNPAAPLTPFQMEDYEVPEKVEAQAFAKEAISLKNAANKADQNADNYLLLSIIIATVLFFTGLSGVTNSSNNKRILLITAIVLLTIVIVMTFRLPVLL